MIHHDQAATAAEITECYDIGRNEPPERFLEFRAQWLGDPGSVRLQQTTGGGWDIVLRIDGTYFTDEVTAQRIADTFQAEIRGIADQLRDA
ncbi:MAG: hypothetical protein ACRDTV_06300 [Mycobacterium sp.]